MLGFIISFFSALSGLLLFNNAPGGIDAAYAKRDGERYHDATGNHGENWKHDTRGDSNCFMTKVRLMSIDAPEKPLSKGYNIYSVLLGARYTNENACITT